MKFSVSAILDGLTVAGMHWHLVLGVLLLLIVSYLFLVSMLQRILGDWFRRAEYVSLGLAGWLLPASILALLWYLFAKIFSLQISAIVTGILVVAGLIWSIRIPRTGRRSSRAVVWSLFILAGLFIILRLPYVSRAIVPLYFDSAQHYRYIHDLLANIEQSSGTGSLVGYYHFGFHFLDALLTSLTGAKITDTMLVLGQAILALLPFSMFFIIVHGTRSNSAGFFAVALAAFGWYMPAHAIDWGKYPALASLAFIPFVASLAYLALQNRSIFPNRKYMGLLALLGTALIVSILLHSRSLVVYLLLALAWLITLARSKFSKSLQLVFLALFLLAALVGIYFIQSQGVFLPLIDAYGTKAILITASALVLSLFAYRSYPGLVFFCLVATSLFLASLFVYLGNLIPGYANTTLLDRPYVQMLLYLPLTLLAGFGLAGLQQFLQGRNIKWQNRQLAWGNIATVFFILLVAVNALFKYDLYPAVCCVIVSQDDLTAIHWLDENLPKNALLLTSSTDLKVLPTDKYQGSAGGDAGTWITPLTGRPVALMPFNTDFSQPQTLDALCQQQVNYVYVGKTGWFFNDQQISAQPANYKILLDLPRAKVYQVTGCK